MAHVASFEIVGLNGRKVPISHSLDRHVNVFFGSNGSGKTSILRIIDSAMSNDAGRAAATTFDRASVTIHSIDYKHNFTMRYDNGSVNDGRPKGRQFTESGEAAADQLSLPADISLHVTKGWEITPERPKRQKERVQRWTHSFLPTSRLYQGGPPRPRRQYLMPQADLNPPDYDFDIQFVEEVQRIWSRSYGETLGRVRSIQQEGLQNILLDMLWSDSTMFSGRQGNAKKVALLDADSAFNRVSSFLKRQPGQGVLRPLQAEGEFVRRYESEPQLQHMVAQIDSIESKIEAEMKPIEELSSLIKQLFGTGKSISFDSPRIAVQLDSGQEIGIERLSSGEKHLVLILLTAITAGPSTVLIDEPELSLHIDWQRQLISIVRQLNPECQLILATHSPEIMADVPDENIFHI